MNDDQARRRYAMPFSCLLAVAALLATACGGSGSGGSGGSGNHTGTGASGTSSSSGGSSNSCCLNGTNFTCPTASDAEDCFNNETPGACTQSGTCSSGSSSSSSGSSTGTSSGGDPMCGTGTLASDIGKECQDTSDCSTNFCDQNTPNALNSYCSQACSTIADCPCAGGSWTCDLNPKYSAVQKYCINQNAGG